MMDQQFDPMNEQPNNDQRDRQDIVSADPPRDAAPGGKQAPQETPPVNPPADTPGTSVNAVNQQDQEAVNQQQPQPTAANGTASPLGSHPSPDGASVEAVEAGDARPGQDKAPTRTAGRPESGDAQPIPLLSAEVADAFLGRWGEMQAAFVDEPRQVVEQADSLVAEVMQRIAETMAQERTGLERQWTAGDDASTEDLRLALQHYRSFFQRLLSA